MSGVRQVDLPMVDLLFRMGSGYVLNFSDRTIRTFFAEELDIDLDAPEYQKDGTSKAKRVRCLLRSVDVPTAVRVLNAMWAYRQRQLEIYGNADDVLDSEAKFLSLLARIKGETAATAPRSTAPAVPVYDLARIGALKQQLHDLGPMQPQPRGFAFERFLHDLFDAYRLSPRASFRIVGEQIDGSFQIGQDTYLLEAKWQSPPCDAADLHVFHGKLEGKAAWSRGLFLSVSGFSDDGLLAFGSGKRLLCMDALDLWEMLERQIPFPDVVERKARRAAETGAPFVRVRDLFH